MGLLLAVCMWLLLALKINAQCEGPSITISSLADTQAISSCRAYNGSITIATSAEGDIWLESLESISGNLTVVDVPALRALHVPNVTTITGTLKLISLPNLTTLVLSSMTSINTLEIDDLPALQSIGFDAGLADAKSITISNTGLLNLSGFTLLVAGLVDVNNNPNLDTVELNDIENVTETLSFKANAPNLNIQLGSLQFVYGNLLFANISALSTPDLQNVTGAFTCQSCSMATYKSQWLMSVGLDLLFEDTDLSSLEFPDLWHIGRLSLADNTNLKHVDFNMLESVGADMSLIGDFDSVGFANLNQVSGTVNVLSTTSNSSVCEFFDSLKNDSVITGELLCKTDGVPLQTNGTLSDSNSQQDSSHALSGGAIAGVVIGVLAFVGIVGVAAFVIRRKRGQTKPGNESKELDSDRKAFTELPQSSREKLELYGDNRSVKEMEGNNRPLPPEPKSIPGIHEVDARSRSKKAGSALQASSDGSRGSPLSPQHYDMGWGSNSSQSGKQSRGQNS